MRAKASDLEIAETAAALAEIEADYRAWDAEYERRRQELVKGEMDWWKAMEVVHQQRLRDMEEGSVPVDLCALDQLLGAMCALYLQVDADRRQAIRDLFEGRSVLLNRLHHYMGLAARRLQETQDKGWLRMGLAAASICDRRVDWRDLMVRLGDLYLTASALGMRPGYQFRAVSRISNPSRRYKEASTRDLLAGFRKTAYLRRLRRRQRADLAPAEEAEG